MKTSSIVRSAIAALVGLVAVSLALVPATGRASVVNVKTNWDIGMLSGFTLTYRDAHIKIASKGYISDPPTKIIDGNFGKGSSTSTVTHGSPDDTLEVNWVNKAGVTGQTHIGVDFDLNTLGGKVDVRVLKATLTDVSGTNGSSSFSGLNSVDIPGPPSIYWTKSNSAAVTLGIDNPALVTPVTFSGVEFYKSAIEPPIEMLNAANFGALPKTFLLAVPDFVLATGGTTDIEVPGIVPPEWLIAHYTNTWVDPSLSAIIGGPAVMSVETWFAGQLVPEPTTWVLVVMAAVVLAPWCWCHRSRLRKQSSA